MSSTNRGAERVEADFYPTPLDSFDPLLPYLPRDGQVWEPCWGDGRLVRRMLENEIDAWGTDLHDRDEPTDFLKDETPRYCILTNPPFSIAFEMAQHALTHAEHVFFLLRLNFLASKTRKAWWLKNEPDCLFILSDRPGFVLQVTCSNKKCAYKKTFPIGTIVAPLCPACGQKVKKTSSDSCEYAWYYWGDLHHGIIHL